MNAYNELEKGIKYVLDNCTSYQVAKDLNIPNRTINRYQNGTTDIENMQLKTAKKIYEYYKEEIKMRTWERNGYEVVEVDFDGDLKEFEVIKNEEIIATITPDSVEAMNQIIEDL